MKYTKKEIDGLLSLKSEWTTDQKQKQIKKLFKKFNALTNTSNSQKEIDNAERMMEICAEAILVYKSPAHKRNYQKKVVKKRQVAKSTVEQNDGCIIPIIVTLSSFGIFIWLILYGLF